ncbi:SCO family protein [Aurantiacibacter marinus]|uniref:Thioredoxin domain-containing protein n=1 Tax=Aurantiacibacter marinus TaxID=874156 RepID=A0A0H0XQZ5_9SPHN|nr:SCO family protein [Aurantiacibacter marinus]KLI65028.1 hypothetical protein AAV99_06065 [Aurantiacibacter marinus]
MPAYSKLFARLAAPALLCTMLVACGPVSPDAPEEVPSLYGSDVVGGFDLVDSTGKQVSDTDFLGRYQVVYFGYAYCPDVCPFDIQRMVQGLNAFAAANPDLADDVQPIFITVDPERDTPEVIDEFTANFSDDLIGLTGSPEAIEAAAANYFASYSRLEPNERGDYLMSHTNFGYLVDREGKPMTLLPVDQSADAVAAELERWVR